MYRPKTKETRTVYESILSIVQKHMGDVSLEVLRGATDEVLAILKTDNITGGDIERKREIEAIVDRLSQETYN